MEYYLSALALCLQPINLVLIFAMVALGIVFGAIPGLSATLGITLLLPVIRPLHGDKFCPSAGNLDWRRIRLLYLRSPDWHSRLVLRHRYLF